MSLNRYVRQLNPIQENKINYVDRVKYFITESSLSKNELQKPAGKGPNSGVPRVEIFADKVKNGEDHMLKDGSTIKVKEITMNGKVYSVKNMDSFVKDFENVETIKVTNPDISMSKFAKTPEYGGEGGGAKISTSVQELMTAAVVLGGKKYDAQEISVDDAKKIIDEAKKQWGNIVGVTGKEDLLNQFNDNWYDLATAISSANAIFKVVPKASKVFWTGQSWDKEIQAFNPPIGNIRDYNSSDIVVKGSDGKYYGFSLKKKKTSKDQDPTLINKPITGKSSLLKEFISDAQYQRMERAKKLFFIRMVVSYPPFIKKNGKNQYKLVQRMSDKEFRTEVGKIPNDFANDMLAGSGVGGRRNIFWRVVNDILQGDTKAMMESFLKLIFKVDLLPILKNSGKFDFYLLTGIGRPKKNSIGVEPAEIKDLPTTVEALTKIFSQQKIRLGKTLDKNGKPRRLPWEFSKNEKAPAKLMYTIYNGQVPLINLEIRYKGSKTAEPQFQASATPMFKNIMSCKNA